MIRRTVYSWSVLLLSILLFAAPLPASGEETVPAPKRNTDTPAQGFKRIKLVFEPDAYYANLGLILSLTDAPIPQLGELTEAEIYYNLLSQAALLPQFMVFEASVNPLPYAGTYIKEHNPDLYGRARISGSFNWIKALTAGFEEPYAASILAGNVANFDIPGVTDTKGIGYSGYLASAGNYHIKDNELIRDKWWELEWKLKGDRRSPVKKLSWSFRIGAKLHGNPDITDIIYLSARRSRIDYKTKESSLFHNSGFEYTYDMDRRTFNPVRHYFFVDKKWPLQNRQIAFSLALGFVWESSKKYTGALAAGREKNDLQVLFRPNIEF